MDNGGFPDLSGVIGNLLSNPEALSGVIGAVAGLKNAGLFEGLSSFSPDAPTPNGSEKTGGREEPQKESDEPVLSYRQGQGAYTEEDGMNASKSPKTQSLPPSLFPSIGGQSGSYFPPPASGFGGRREPDRRRDLLLALRPYLCAERQERLDGILKILGLLEMARHLGLGLGGEQEGSR